MKLKKALDLIFLGFTAKEQVPFRKCSVRVLLPCKGPGARGISIWHHRVPKHSRRRLSVRHVLQATHTRSMGSHPRAPIRFFRSGRSVSRRHCEALDVSDEVEHPLIALNCLVGRAPLDDLAHLICTGRQSLSAGEDVGEYPAERVNLVEDREGYIRNSPALSELSRISIQLLVSSNFGTARLKGNGSPHR